MKLKQYFLNRALLRLERAGLIDVILDDGGIVSIEITNKGRRFKL